MMTPRFNLFFAGYSAYAPVQYYSKLKLVTTYQDEKDEQIVSRIAGLKSSLEDEEPEYTSYLTSAMAIAKDFELAVLPQPTSHQEYFEWLQHYTIAIENHFPMSRIEHYYFLYARKIGEIVSNNSLLRCYVEVNRDLNGKVDFRQKMEKCLRDTEYILFKLVASAALLSSEPRHNYFNLLYKEMNLGFQPFRELDVKELSEDICKVLIEDLNNYNSLVIDGFKKGIGLLKELQS